MQSAEKTKKRKIKQWKQAKQMLKYEIVGLISFLGFYH